MLCHHQRMFPLCTWQLILRDDLPSVWVVLIDKHAPRPHVNHRFDGEHHARHKQHTRTAMPEMSHIGLLVELQSNAMSTEVTYHTIIIFLTMAPLVMMRCMIILLLVLLVMMLLM